LQKTCRKLAAAILHCTGGSSVYLNFAQSLLLLSHCR